MPARAVGFDRHGQSVGGGLKAGNPIRMVRRDVRGFARIAQKVVERGRHGGVAGGLVARDGRSDELPVAVAHGEIVGVVGHGAIPLPKSQRGGRRGRAAKVRGKTHPVERQRGAAKAANVGKRGQQIGEVRGEIAATGSEGPGPREDERHADAALKDIVFRAATVVVEARTGERIGTVVAGEDHEGALAQAKFGDSRQQCADPTVEDLDHGVDGGRVFGKAAVSVGFDEVGGRAERTVRSVVRQVQEKRRSAVAAHEIDREWKARR